MNLQTTCQVNISSDKIKDCREIAQYLKQLNIAANVTSNSTIVKKDGKMISEIGCTIIYSCKVDKMYDELWRPLKQKYLLGCAHVDIKSNYQGCIYDLYRETNCPGQISKPRLFTR
jgi:hypothetical protein